MLLSEFKTCCFSGYRPEKFLFPLNPHTFQYEKLEQAISDALVNAAEDGYNAFICGMSKGFDLMCGNMVIDLRGSREICYDFRLIAAIPHEGFSDNWKREWRDAYDDVYDCADEIIYTSKRYDKSSYFVRNRFMIDNSSRIICYWDGKLGGTAYTVHYARKKGIEVVNLADNM